MTSSIPKISSTATTHAVLVCNGTPPSAELVRTVTSESLLVGVDGGATTLYELGFIPSFVVGDLDSLDKKIIAALESRGSIFLRHPTEKNHTDLELALLHAAELKITAITILGAMGGEADHFFGNALLLTLDPFISMDIRLVDETCEIRALPNNHQAHLPVQATSSSTENYFSIIPISDRVEGVTITGAKWNLESATLLRGSSLSTRNQIVEETVTISSRLGAALIVRHTK